MGRHVFHEVVHCGATQLHGGCVERVWSRNTNKITHIDKMTFGFLHVLYLHNNMSYHISAQNQLSELLNSRKKIKYLYPDHMSALFANKLTVKSIRKSSLWDIVGLHDMECATLYDFKLWSLAYTPFDTTIFVDNDVQVMNVRFLPSMQAYLSNVDFAAPASPSGKFMLGTYQTLFSRTLLCSCLMIYNKNISAIFLNAMRALALRTRPQLMRQGDQEYLWFELEHVRIRILPPESYCEKRYNPRHVNSTWIIPSSRGSRREECWSLHTHVLLSAGTKSLKTI